MTLSFKIWLIHKKLETQQENGGRGKVRKRCCASLGSDHEGGGVGEAINKTFDALKELPYPHTYKGVVFAVAKKWLKSVKDRRASNRIAPFGLIQVPTPSKAQKEESSALLSPLKTSTSPIPIVSPLLLHQLSSPIRYISHVDQEASVQIIQTSGTGSDTDAATISHEKGDECAVFSSILTTESVGSGSSSSNISSEGKGGTDEYQSQAGDYAYGNRYIEYEDEGEGEDGPDAAGVRGSFYGEGSSAGSSGGSANSKQSLLLRAQRPTTRRIVVQSEDNKCKESKNKSVSDSNIHCSNHDIKVGILNKIQGNSDSTIEYTHENGRAVSDKSNCHSQFDNHRSSSTSISLDRKFIPVSSEKAHSEKKFAHTENLGLVGGVSTDKCNNSSGSTQRHGALPKIVLNTAESSSLGLNNENKAGSSKHSSPRSSTSTAVAAAAKAVFQTVSWENVPGPSGDGTKTKIRHAVSDSGTLSGTSSRGKGKAIVTNGSIGSSNSSTSLYRADHNGYHNKPHHHRSLENGGVHSGSGHQEKISFWKELPQYQLSNYHQAHQQRVENNGSGHSTPIATTSSGTGHYNQHSRYHRYYQDADRRGYRDLKIQDIVKNGIEIYPPGVDSRCATPRVLRDHSPIWVTRTSRPGAVADLERQPPLRPGGAGSGFVAVRGSHTTLGDEDEDEEWAERVSLSDASDYPYQGPGRHSPRLGTTEAGSRTAAGAVGRRGAGSGPPGKRKPGDVRGGRRGMMSRPGRRGCCKIIHLKEDNARFILLAIVMVVYMLTGAALFTALERDNEVSEKRIYQQRVENFKIKYPEVNISDLEYLLDIHSKAETAGYVGDRRPRWDFPGSFYFVGTVVSTIGFKRFPPTSPTALLHNCQFNAMPLMLRTHFIDGQTGNILPSAPKDTIVSRIRPYAK
ncbi:potassium channel subfamily k member 13-like [Plakobranchus ocellatus]|uniref:Potassium channel subfamily k member 13-like n=1 Tax=Plakobranchus ocellatus TaxID=259542 RepID=A0AAV4DX74_9GAST|nr:potassium channel subfamily k member 13-like [Plakobranchus ocellatus]